jgi:threonine/homoserine/homoserine lactone efflux protein
MPAAHSLLFTAIPPDEGAHMPMWAFVLSLVLFVLGFILLAAFFRELAQIANRLAEAISARRTRRRYHHQGR